MGRFVGLGPNRGKGSGGSGTIIETTVYDRNTGITTYSNNNVGIVTLGNNKYTEIQYNNVGLITGYNEIIGSDEKGWILTYDSVGIVSTIVEREELHPVGAGASATGGEGGGGGGGGGGGASGLFEFDTATFTALTRSKDGPSLSEAKTLCTGISANNFKNNTNYFNVSSGILLWTVPRTKTYRIKAAGSRGGPNYDYNFSVTQDSRGAIMQAEFSLTEGDTVAMVIGSEGDPGYGNDNTGSCGGGGTFVWIGDSSDIGGNTLLLAAGGGASACPKNQSRTGSEDGQTSTYAINSGGAGGSNNRGTPGQNGNSGQRYANNDYDGGAGAGWLNNQSTNEDGKRFSGGSDLDQSTPAHGGWGGGGGANDSVREQYVGAEGINIPWAHGRAGGGGYSGGSGNYYDHTGSGGGSYCKSTGSNLATSNGSFATTGNEHSPVYSGSVTNLSDYNAGPGYVVITELN
mgnify:FL=1